MAFPARPATERDNWHMVPVIEGIPWAKDFHGVYRVCWPTISPDWFQRCRNKWSGSRTARR